MEGGSQNNDHDGDISNAVLGINSREDECDNNEFSLSSSPQEGTSDSCLDLIERLSSSESRVKKLARLCKVSYPILNRCSQKDLPQWYARYYPLLKQNLAAYFSSREDGVQLLNEYIELG